MLVNRSTGDVPGGPVAKTGLLPIQKPGLDPRSGNFPGAQTVKNLPAMQETWVQSLGGEDRWRRERLPTLGFLPGEFHGQRSLVDCSPWGCEGSDTTE